MQNKNKYDVALSFAGEDRPYVKSVAELLKSSNISFFYDEYEEVNLWGKDLLQHLHNVYYKDSNLVVIFASKNYAKKLWTSQELKAAQAKAFELNREYILPARFDDTEIPGILPTIGHIDLTKKTPQQFAALIIEKISTLNPGMPIPIQQNPKSPSKEIENDGEWYSTDGKCPNCKEDNFIEIGRYDGGGTVFRRCKKCNARFRYDFY